MIIPSGIGSSYPMNDPQRWPAASVQIRMGMPPGGRIDPSGRRAAHRPSDHGADRCSSPSTARPWLARRKTVRHARRCWHQRMCCCAPRRHSSLSDVSPACRYRALARLSRGISNRMLCRSQNATERGPEVLKQDQNGLPGHYATLRRSFLQIPASVHFTSALRLKTH